MGDDIVDFGHGVVRSGGATSFLDDSLFGVWGDEVDDDKGRRRDKGKDELDTGRIEDPRGGRGIRAFQSPPGIPGFLFPPPVAHSCPYFVSCT